MDLPRLAGWGVFWALVLLLRAAGVLFTWRFPRRLSPQTIEL